MLSVRRLSLLSTILLATTLSSCNSGSSSGGNDLGNSANDDEIADVVADGSNPDPETSNSGTGEQTANPDTPPEGPDGDSGEQTANPETLPGSPDGGADEQAANPETPPGLLPQDAVVLPPVCVDLRPFDPNAVAEAAGSFLSRYKWDDRDVITVSFMGGDSIQQAVVRQNSQAWEQHANIDFQFVQASGDIRVDFQPGKGSNSQIGNGALSVSPAERTMNFDGNHFGAGKDEEVMRRMVLHEFGHALGLVHEHQSPTSNVPWNRDIVIKYYSEPEPDGPGWDVDRIEKNIFQKYSYDETNSTVFDKDSIMLYPIDNSLTIGDYSTEWNPSISATDARLISAIYPEETSSPTPTPQTALQSGRSFRFECRKQTSRGCTAHAQTCIAPRPGTRFRIGSTRVRILDSFGIRPVCRLDSELADEICITGHVESGSGSFDINKVYTIDCHATWVDEP